MKVENFFLSNRRLKSPWRIFIFLLLTFPPLYLVSILLWDNYFIKYLLSFIILLMFSLLAAKYLDKKPPGLIGFLFHSRWLKDYLWGVLIGFISVSALFLLVLSLNAIEVDFRRITLNLLVSIFLFSLTTTVFQSAFEEFLFRGYLYQNLIEATNVVVATIVMSSLFGIGHMLTPHSRWIVAANLTMFGIWHSIGYLTTKSLWLPSGLHFSWNFFMRNIYSLPVSGSESSQSLLSVKGKGPLLLTGGEYGPEAGIPALAVMILMSLFIYYHSKIKTAPETEKLLRAIS